MENNAITDIGSLANAYSDRAVRRFDFEIASVAIANSELIGANTNQADILYIPMVDVGGMSNYDKQKGMKRGTASIKREPYRVSVRRSASIPIDRLEVERQGNLNLIGEILWGVAENLSAELDAYRFAKWASGAELSGSTTLTTANIVAELDAALTSMYDAGNRRNKVIFMSAKTLSILRNSPERKNQFVFDVSNEKMNYRTSEFNGVKIVEVPSGGFGKTITLLDDEAGGFTVKDPIDFMIASQGSVWYYKAMEEVIVVDPDFNKKSKDLDAYTVSVIMHHDAGVIKGLGDGVYVHSSKVTASDEVKKVTPKGVL